MIRVVLVRHGQSAWNLENRFTRSECLKDTVERLLPYWHLTTIVQSLIEERLTWPVRAVLMGGGGHCGHFLLDFSSPF